MTQIQRREQGQVRRMVDDDAPPLAELNVQETQTKYTTAMRVQIPRELPVVESRALEEATLMGADGYYAWGQNKDRIEGPSKDLAMALIRCYGNCAVDLGDVQETRDAWIFTATFVDLETGFTLARQFRQAKSWAVYGKFDDARKDDIRFQIGQSKAVRNVILNAVPGWLVRRAMDRCKGGVREMIEATVAKHGMEKVVDRAMVRLAQLGADAARVCDSMGRKNAAGITLEDMVILHGNIAAIESGADTVDEVFPARATTKPSEDARSASAADRLVSKLAPKPDAQPETRAEPATPAPADEPAPSDPAAPSDALTPDQANFLASMDQPSQEPEKVVKKGTPRK
jgi:hypothetical protein